MAVQQATRQSVQFDPEEIEAFRTSMKGDVILPDDERYGPASAIWNGMIDKQPAIVAHVVGVADVMAAVRFATGHRLPIAIRGGGHNVAGNALCEGGMLINMSRMRSVRVDPGAKTVRAEGGALWADVDRETQVFGLATPGGNVSVTGIAGLTLHGGMGHLRRKHGFSVDNLLSVDVVTADGTLRTASATENPDLFWAMRGAGSNFGVVTSLEFHLHPVGPTVALCAPMYPVEDAPRMLAQWRDYIESAPDEVSSIGFLWSVPAAPGFPAELHNRPVFIPLAVYCGDATEGERVMRPLRELGTPVIDLSGQMPFTALQAAFDGLFPDGDQYYFKSQYVDGLTDELITELCNIADTCPSPRTLTALWHHGGASARVGTHETPLARRDAPYLASFDGVWSDPADNERNLAWARSAWAAMQRYSSGGVYLNFVGLGEEKEELVRAGYGDNYERLVQVKNKYDPTNVFRVNNNIRPTVS
jgi:FAD/FMN-containing dehydrogenase